MNRAAAEAPPASSGPSVPEALKESLKKAMWDMHISNLCMDIGTFHEKTTKDIENAYCDIQTRMIREDAPIQQLERITISFHEVIKRRTGRELSTATGSNAASSK